MRVVIAGSSGFLGTALRKDLVARGHEIVSLVRRPASTAKEIPWDPARGVLPADALAGADAVINLCGVPVVRIPWTQRHERAVRSSRVGPTALLAQAVADAGVPALINASATGFYGDTGDATVDEHAPAGVGLLADICAEWEAAAAPASDARVVLLRTGVVVHPESLFNRRLKPLFWLGLGGRIGSGRQYLSWIALADWLAATSLIVEGDLTGPVNLVSPLAVTNAEFTRLFAASLRRPAVLPVPAFALRLALRGAAPELLASHRVAPAALEQAGFEFTLPDLADALRA